MYAKMHAAWSSDSVLRVHVSPNQAQPHRWVFHVLIALHGASSARGPRGVRIRWRSRVGLRVSAWKRRWRNCLHICGGWRSYFGLYETPDVLIGLTRSVRLRLRAAMWRQWKTPRRRRATLIELGVGPRLASNTAGSGLGPLVPREGRGPVHGALQCALQIARTFVIVRGNVGVTISNHRVWTRTHGGVAGVGG